MLKSKALFLGLMAVLVAGFALGGQAIPNWSAPATWSPASSGGVHTMDLTNPLPFIPVTPCRVADTRGNGFVGAYGPPSLVANANRNFTITGQCGIPISASAVSFNFGALNVGGAGDLRVFPAGAGTPLVSTLNYNANTPNIANAAVVPLGAGAITVRADVVSIDLIIDVNGYYFDSSQGDLTNDSFFSIVGSYTGFFGLGGGVIFAQNKHATTFNGWGVNAFSTSTGAGSAGLHGHSSATTGVTYGVIAESASSSNGSAGVRGNDGSGTPAGGTSFLRSGVLGLSLTGDGVKGVDQSGAGGNGVSGIRTNSNGSVGSEGDLAFTVTTAGFFNGDVSVTGSLSVTGTKSFVEPHPTDASKEIRYVSLEGPESGVYFRGRSKFQNGIASIDIPENFRMVADPAGLSIQITPIGDFASFAVLQIDLGQIVVKGSRNVEFFYTVNGVRALGRDFEPIGPVGDTFAPKGPESILPNNMPAPLKARLIANGTYKEDGTVNMETAERLGWAATWRAQAEALRKIAEAARAEQSPDQSQDTAHAINGLPKK